MIVLPLLLAAAPLTFTADRIAAGNVTGAAVATGHVVAVSSPYSLRSDYMERDEHGRMFFRDPTCATTCTNQPGICHWEVRGEVEYEADDHVLLRNAWLRFFEVPILWLPYLYYPLNWDCGFSWMPGYIGKWGAFLLTKYTYDIAGDRNHADNTWWLRGDTRFDLRYKQGVAFGEDLFWNLGDFGAGSFELYYASDTYSEPRYGVGGRYQDALHWGSPVERERYGLSLQHRWDVTERDSLQVRGSFYSDSYFRNDFHRKSFFNLKSQFLDYRSNGVFWEHIENAVAFGGEVSGRLNDFYAMTDRLPEFYFDVNPLPVFGSFVNYESESRLGWLQRHPAAYGLGNPDSIYAYQPGLWANQSATRFDTYHRFTAPFSAFDDVMAVVPRVAGRGTYWSACGRDNLDGWGHSTDEGAAERWIGEVGTTLSARGSAFLNDDWRHIVEPYLDFLAQEAWYSGLGNGNRPYVFDTLDASSTWEDQFAGRSRNLPYSYYGITPGVRNAWDRVDENGNIRKCLDLDFYVAAQFNTATYVGEGDSHRLAEAGSPNYGRNGCEFVPGARLRWMPMEKTMLSFRGEYDSDNNRFAYVQTRLTQEVTRDFSWYGRYFLRDHRFWDFSSCPFDPEQGREDSQDLVRLHMAEIGFEHKLCEWLAWGPRIRWDLRHNELDCVGTWIDYLTDCLGFRLLLEYDNSYDTVDGYHNDENYSIGFYIYLRAFGSDSGNIFQGGGR